MRNRIAALVGVVVAGCLVASTGCVSKKAYQQSQDASEARVDAIESSVEANQRRLNDLPDIEVRIAESQYGHEASRVGVHTVRIASRLQVDLDVQHRRYRS